MAISPGQGGEPQFVSLCGRWSKRWCYGCSLDAPKARYGAPKAREIGRGRDYPASIGPLAYSIGPSAHRNGPARQDMMNSLSDVFFFFFKLLFILVEVHVRAIRPVFHMSASLS